MKYPKELPGVKTANKHSAYSRYNSVNPLTYSVPLRLKFDKEQIPFRDPSIFRLMTFNLNWFPKSLNSETLFSYILQCSLPDIIFLQEIKHMHVLRSLLNTINGKVFPDNYCLLHGQIFAGCCNTAIVYNSHILKPESHHDLFTKSNFSNAMFPRFPFIASFKILNSVVNFINLHLISYRKDNHSAVLESCFRMLKRYFFDSNFIDPIFIGGDWNIDSRSTLLANYFPDFYRELGNFKHKSDYFLLLSNDIVPDDLFLIKQFKMSVTSIFELSYSEYRQSLSDHYPVILEAPISMFS